MPDVTFQRQISVILLCFFIGSNRPVINASIKKKSSYNRNECHFLPDQPADGRFTRLPVGFPPNVLSVRRPFSLPPAGLKLDSRARGRSPPVGRRSGCVLEVLQEVLWFALQSCSDLFQQADADIAFAALDVAQIALPDREFLRQLGLGYSQLDPSDLDASTNSFVDAHNLYPV